MSTDLESRLARLEDIAAVTKIKWDYLRACDRKQPEAVRACLTPDAVLDYEGFPLFTDRDSFVDIFAQLGCVPHIVDMHHGLHPIVTVEGDRATGTFDLLFFQIDTNANRHMQLAVSYDDTFVRQDGTWLIQRSISRRMSMLVKTIDDDGREKVVVAGRSDSDDPPPPPRG